MLSVYYAPRCVLPRNNIQITKSNILQLRLQRREYLKKPVKTPVDWCIVEEINNEINKQKIILSQLDSLEEYCTSNPSDKACRTYDM